MKNKHSVLNKLSSIANDLDKKSLYKISDKIDSVILKLSSSKYKEWDAGNIPEDVLKEVMEQAGYSMEPEPSPDEEEGFSNVQKEFDLPEGVFESFIKGIAYIDDSYNPTVSDIEQLAEKFSYHMLSEEINFITDPVNFAFVMAKNWMLDKVRSRKARERRSIMEEKERIEKEKLSRIKEVVESKLQKLRQEFRDVYNKLKEDKRITRTQPIYLNIIAYRYFGIILDPKYVDEYNKKKYEEEVGGEFDEELPPAPRKSIYTIDESDLSVEELYDFNRGKEIYDVFDISLASFNKALQRGRKILKKYKDEYDISDDLLFYISSNIFPEALYRYERLQANNKEANTTVDVIKHLVKISNELDQNRFYAEADKVDEVITSIL